MTTSHFIGQSGDRGATGQQGPKGSTGDIGPPGTQGVQGLRGLAGRVGPQGKPVRKYLIQKFNPYEFYFFRDPKVNAEFLDLMERLEKLDLKVLCLEQSEYQM